ncbi:RraA-like protein, partial [Ramaria rubella]
MVLGSDLAAPKLDKHFVDEATPDSIIVIDAPPQTKSAVWGGLMTAGAMSRGCLGVVISGRARDLSEHIESNFPVFARSHSTLGQSPFTRPSEINVPLTIHPQPGNSDFPPLSVHPGDIIVADRDGVVCVPASLVDEAVEFATKGQKIDAKCMEDIQAGKGIKESF